MPSRILTCTELKGHCFVCFSFWLRVLDYAEYSAFESNSSIFCRIVSFSPARSRAPALSLTRCVNTSIGLQCINTDTDTEYRSSSKVIGPGVNRKLICNFLLFTNSNFGRISYCFRDIDGFSFKIACFPHPTIV